MPAIQRGHVDRVRPGHWRLRYYVDGIRKSKQPFPSKSEAWTWYRTHVESQLNGEAPKAELTVSEFITLYLERHKQAVRPRTIATLKERLGHAEKPFGSILLSDFQGMTDEIAAWIAKQPSGVAYGRTGALRQVLGAAVRWGYIDRNPAVLVGKNRQPAPRTVRVFTYKELDAISAELSTRYEPLPAFVAATGLRPEEWQALERRDIDRNQGLLSIRRTVSSGQVVELGKTSRSRRQVPLSPRALSALEALPPRLDTPLVFPSSEGKVLHLDNFRYREWSPAIEAAAIPEPARIYDLRSTFASNALAAGIAVFELAKVMGTSVDMIERHYGSLLDGAGAGIASRLAVFEAAQAEEDEEAV